MIIRVGHAADLAADDVALREKQNRVARELRPALGHVAVHVDEHGSGCGFGRVDGIAVPAFVRLVDRGAGWKDGWRHFFLLRCARLSVGDTLRAFR